MPSDVSCMALSVNRLKIVYDRLFFHWKTVCPPTDPNFVWLCFRAHSTEYLLRHWWRHLMHWAMFDRDMCHVGDCFAVLTQMHDDNIEWTTQDSRYIDTECNAHCDWLPISCIQQATQQPFRDQTNCNWKTSRFVTISALETGSIFWGKGLELGGRNFKGAIRKHDIGFLLVLHRDQSDISNNIRTTHNRYKLHHRCTFAISSTIQTIKQTNFTNNIADCVKNWSSISDYY